MNPQPPILHRKVLKRIRRPCSTLVVYFPHCGMGDTIVFQSIITYWHMRCRTEQKRLVACIFRERFGYRVEHYNPVPDEIWMLDPNDSEDNVSPESVLQCVQSTYGDASMVWYKPYTYVDSAHEKIISIEPYTELGMLASNYKIFPTFNVKAESMVAAAGYLSQAGIDARKTRLFAIHCRGKEMLFEKNLNVSLLKEVIEYLRDFHVAVPIVIGKDDVSKVLIEASALLWPCDDSFQLTAALLKLSCVFIGGDSGPGHLAAAVATPVVSVQNPIRAGFHWGPFCLPERLSRVSGTQAPAPAPGLLFDVEEVCQSASRFLQFRPCE